jgi:hypothetical protein
MGGVDPEHYSLSFEDGAAYTEKAKIELVSQAGDVTDPATRLLTFCL